MATAISEKLGKGMGALRGQFSNLDAKNPGRWPILPQILCAMVVTIAVVAASWFVILEDRWTFYESKQQEEVKLKEVYREKLKEAVKLDGLRKQKALIDEYVLQMERQLPSKAEMDALLSDINNSGVGRGLQFELFKPGKLVVKKYYAELPINIKVSGGFHDIASFASDIANLPRIVTLNDMQIAEPKAQEKNARGLVLNVVAKTFRYLDADELAAQRAEREKNKAKAKKSAESDKKAGDKK